MSFVHQQYNKRQKLVTIIKKLPFILQVLH